MIESILSEKVRCAISRDAGKMGLGQDAATFFPNFLGLGMVAGGIYAGHGGKEAAEYAKNNLLARVACALGAARGPKTPAVLRRELSSSYRKISGEIRKYRECGTCAADFIIKDGILVCANVGKVKIVVVKDRGFVHMTGEHAVSNPNEVQRIKELGGCVEGSYVVFGTYRMETTRSLGDVYVRGLTCLPEIGVRTLTSKDKWLIAGSLGLFEKMAMDEVAVITKLYAYPRQIAENLAHIAVKERECQRDCTILVLDLKHLVRKRIAA